MAGGASGQYRRVAVCRAVLMPGGNSFTDEWNDEMQRLFSIINFGSADVK